MKIMKLYAFLLIAMGLLALSLSPFLASTSSARSKAPSEINAEVDAALALFSQQVNGGKDLLRSAKGVLVIPNITKAGLGMGGLYGEGALRVHGKTVGYYNIAGGAMGFVIGGEKKDLVLIFMQDEALEDFRTSSNWTAGFDFAITAGSDGTEGYTNTQAMDAPVIAFVFNERGLMFDASIEGTKFSKMEKSDEMVGKR